MTSLFLSSVGKLLVTPNAPASVKSSFLHGRLSSSSSFVNTRSFDSQTASFAQYMLALSSVRAYGPAQSDVRTYAMTIARNSIRYVCGLIGDSTRVLSHQDADLSFDFQELIEMMHQFLSDIKLHPEIINKYATKCREKDKSSSTFSY
jgi:hypothetical protein